MAIAQADIDRMETALSKGILTVERDGRRVTYQTSTELLKAISYAKAELAAAAGTGTTQSFAQFTRG